MSKQLQKMNLLTLVIPLFFLSVYSLVAQGTVKPKSGASNEKKEAPKNEIGVAEKSGAKELGYLDLVYARERALKLKEMNLRDIQLLNSIGNALPEAYDKAGATKVGDEYKEGLKQIYRIDYAAAEKTLSTNRESIAKAMEKASEVYRTKTADLLNESADRMADIELQAENTGSADAVRLMGVVQDNQHRLSVGYQQLTLAATAEKRRHYNEALIHYRLARLHAIYLKLAFAKDDAERKALRET
ncbi:MAG TPA: hypothetical protein PLY93_03700, partial [Turneriella sp.]|nr:hypothetical protein [Turneriella sp.]